MSDLFARFGTEYRAGDVLFREGEHGEVMFVLQTGAVRITKRVGDEDKVIAVLGPGEFVGEMAILNDKPRTATATVTEDARCLVVDGRQLESMLVSSAEIALRLVKKLAKRLDSADALIEILMHRDPRVRVMLGLSRHGEYGEVTEDGIRLRISALDLAREVSVELPVVLDVLKQLDRLRLASTSGDNGEITIADVDRLTDFVEFLDVPSAPSEPLPQ